MFMIKIILAVFVVTSLVFGIYKLIRHYQKDSEESPIGSEEEEQAEASDQPKKSSKKKRKKKKKSKSKKRKRADPDVLMTEESRNG
jgi:mannitol-specific phosphotransferase system IIBC component